MYVIDGKCYVIISMYCEFWYSLFDSLVCVLLVLIDCYNLFILVNIFFICYKNIFFREKLNVYV